MSQDKNKQLGSGNNKGSKKGKSIPFWIYGLILVGILLIPVFTTVNQHENRIDYSTFLGYVEEGYVEEVLIIDGEKIEGVFKREAVEQGLVEYVEPEVPTWSMRSQPEVERYEFKSTMLRGDEIREILDEHGVIYDAKITDDWFGGVFFWLIPIALIIIFWLFIFKRMNPGSQMFNIGKSKASLYDQQADNKVTFKDVAGHDEAKEEVEEVVEFLKHPAKFASLGGAIPKGVLLAGPPGTGKTLLAKATAGEANVPFFSLSGSDFVEMFVGVGAARVRDLFKEAKENAPCIIFIDEIDAIGRSRGKGQSMGSNDERENTLNQLLSEMDGFNTDNGVIIMAASNRPDVLDQALLRPGRFDRQILIDKPDLNGRLQILEVHTKKLIISEHVDLELLASQTAGFAGAELANLCNEAALLAARRDKEKVGMADFQDAVERVVAGLEKKNKIISPQERKIIAYHESGHAIVGWFLEHTDPVLKVSIIPRGFAALGYTLQTPLEDRFLMTREELDDKICALLGGRVAEEVIFGKISTGAQNDLERITKMAFAMVAQYGMSEELGNLSYYDSDSSDDGYGLSKKYSNDTTWLIDKAVKRIIDENYERTKVLLTENKDKLIELAECLLEKEVLNNKELIGILGEPPYPAFGATNNGNGSVSEKEEGEIKEFVEPGQTANGDNGSNAEKDS